MENSFKKKDILLEAALGEFSEHGYQNASLNKILQEAKISKGVFYHYYENKESLYIELTGSLLEKKKEFIMGKIQPSDVESDIFHILKKSMVLSFEFAAENPDMARFSSMLIGERGSDIYKKVMEKYNVNNDTYVSNLIKKAIENGNIRSDLSYDFVFKIISYLLNPVNEILDTKNIEDYESKINDLLTFMEHGLRSFD